MKKFNIRKKLLTLLISGNIILTGCSISGEVSSKKNSDSLDVSYIHNSVDISKNEISYENNSLEGNEEISEVSIDESKEELLINSEVEEDTSVIETTELIEETSDDEISESSDETSDEEFSESSNSYSEDSLEDSNIQTSENEESIIEVYTDDNMYIRSKDDVNVRCEPNIESNVLSILYKGNTLKKIGYIGNWYIVEYNGNKAYVSADYTEEIEQEDLIVDLNESNICYFPYGATLYSDSELTNEIYDIPALESGQITSQEGNVYLVDTCGYSGYVSINLATIIPQPVVIVDKSEQTLRLYKDNILVMEFPVVTGNENPNFYHPTGEGLFDIYSKSYNAELVGDTWDVVVNVFMGFNGGEGIHDAVWRSYFGGDIYTYDGSHGCINCPYDNVMSLAQEVEVGDKVLVKR